MNTEYIDPNLKNERDEITLKEIIFKIAEWWRYLLSKWLIISLIGAVGGVLGFFYAKSKKPIYTATTTFVLDEGGSGGNQLGSLGGLASMAGIDLNDAGGLFQGDNILELYKSRSMIEKTLFTEFNEGNKKELLINKYIDFNSLRSKWEGKPQLANIQFTSNPLKKPNTRLQDSIIGIIVNEIRESHLIVSKPDKKLSIIKTQVSAEDEVFAKNFNEQIVKNVNDFYVQTKTKKSLDNIAILQQKTDSVRAVMNGAIYSAASVLDATPNLNPTRQTQRTAPVQRSQFSAETNKAILSTLVQNLEMSKMNLLKEAPLIQVIDQPVFPLEKEQLGKFRGFVFGGFLFAIMSIFFLLIRLLFIYIRDLD